MGERTATNGTRAYLGAQVREYQGRLDIIPFESSTPVIVSLMIEDFTSLCPVTGQPDFASLEITYRPANAIVETKSLKLFLQQYRNVAAFNEMVVADIGAKIAQQLRPKELVIVARFHARGGIRVEAEYRSDER